MFKNVVLLNLKLTLTTAHTTPRSGHSAVLMLYGQMMMIHSQKSWVISHIWPQEPPTAQHPRRSALTTAPHAWSKLPLRSTVALMPRAAVAAWYGYTTMPRIQIAGQKPRVYHELLLMSHTSSPQDGREGAAWQCWQAQQGGQRSAMLVRVADSWVLVLT